MSTPAHLSAAPAAAPLVSPSLTRSSSPQIDHLFATLVDATFDLVTEVGGTLTLLAYLHVPHDDQPLLFVHEPQLQMLSPTENFRLMHTITMLSNGRKPAAAFRHGELGGHYNRTSGEKSDGLFVFGPIQPSDVAARITSLSRAFARVLHQFHLEDDPLGHGERPVIKIEQILGGLHQATVTIPGDGVTRHGSATGVDAEQAVAQAIIEVWGPGYSFDEVRRIDVGARSAVLVVARDSSRVLRLGLAISDGDILHTVALAARRATGENP